MPPKYDFSGYATKTGVKCTDGRTIMKDAFKDCDGKIVPLVWNHQHNDVTNVLGQVELEHRDDGVYAYGTFNETEYGNYAKELVRHQDIRSMSINAGRLREKNLEVFHGQIREVSLVLSGANPEAYIDVFLEHGDDEDGEADVCFFVPFDIYHSVDGLDETKPAPKATEDETPPETETPKKTPQEIYDAFTEEQKNVVLYLVSQAMEEDLEHSDENNEEDTTVKRNIFDKTTGEEKVLSHADEEAVFADIKLRKFGSLKEAALSHGITDIEYLFPDAKTITDAPDFIQREMDWVREVMAGTHKTPFSRIKSVHADITEADARARGYIKGNLKVDEVFGLLKRSTDPTTIYKKQKLDRDDVIDITDFDVVGWLRTEMRMMLDEEIARAILVGDGRNTSSDDKIDELKIRPIWKDADLYTIKKDVVVAAGATDDVKAKATIRAAVKCRKDYKGSGNPTFFTTEDVLTDMLLMEDSIGHVIYDSVEKLATAMRVKKIVTVPVLEGLTRTRTDNTVVTLIGIIVNLADYNVGADKGGAVSLFDQFDIDYNAQKYLIETRCSGALIKPYSAVALELVTDVA